MNGFLRMCFGQGAEERKFGSFAEPKDYNFNGEKDKKALDDKKHIEDVEARVERKFAASIKVNVDNADRKTVRSRPIRVDENFQPPVFDKTRLQKAFLASALQDNFLFLDLTDDERDMFIAAMEPESFAAGRYIIEQGDVGDYFYIISQGVVDFVKDGNFVGSSQRGGAFGELALLYDAPRAASCVAKNDVQVYKVDQQTFRLMLAKSRNDQHKDVRELIRGISIFKDLDDATLNRFTRAMTTVHWKQGDRIVQKGQVGNVFYIVQEGTVKIHDIGLGDSHFEDQILQPGDWFGERALLTGEPRAANATALSAQTILLAMDRGTFEKTIGPLQGLMEFEMRKKFLATLPLFANSSLTDPELNQLVGLMQEACYSKETKLAEAGRPYGMNLWIIRHGRLLVMNKKSGKIYNLETGDHFGDKSIGGDPAHISSHDAVCEDDLTAWVLSREHIEFVVGDISRLGSPEPPSHQQKPKPFLLSDLRKHKILGQGAFGKVWLVEQKETGDAYALKAIDKVSVIDTKQDDGVMREKELLEMLNHPFILNLISTYQDEQNLYFLLPLIPGGELFSVLHRQKSPGRGLPNNSAAFYSSCVIEALGHFHQRSIAYRDLKLENVMIDEHGYCIIVDLGFAKIVDDKTYTLVGTPEYLAPELIMSKGHDKAVDYWSFGVLCYELQCGSSPFYKPHLKQIEMFKRIVMGKYVIPDYVQEEAGDMIKKLLVRRDTERLGNLAKGHLDIKSHPWYEKSGIDFKSIIQRGSPAPWKPVLKNPLDSSNFDDFSRYENEKYTGRRLTKSEQDKFKDF